MYAFYKRNSPRSLTLQEYTAAIGDYAFAYCTGLTRSIYVTVQSQPVRTTKITIVVQLSSQVHQKLSFCYIDAEWFLHMQGIAVATATNDNAADEKSNKSIWQLLNIRCTSTVNIIFRQLTDSMLLLTNHQRKSLHSLDSSFSQRY